MKKYLILLTSIAIITTVAGQTYTSSPAKGSMSGGVKSDGSFEYKAGEFDVEVEGVLPPINEQLEITSYGKKEGWQQVITNQNSEAWAYISEYGGGRMEEDGYYAWQPGRPGIYKVKINASLTARSEYYDNYDDPSYKFKHDAKLKVWKDERGVCNPSMYPSKTSVKVYEDVRYGSDEEEGSIKAYSSKCGTYERNDAPTFDKFRPRGQDIGMETEDGEPADTDNKWGYSDKGSEGKNTLFDLSVSAPSVNSSSGSCSDGGGKYSYKPGCDAKSEKERNFQKQTEVRIKNQEVSSVSGDRKDDDILESFHFNINGIGNYDYYDGDDDFPVEGEANINEFAINYVSPIGSTMVEVNGRPYSRSPVTVSDYSNTIDSATDWDNTSRTVNLDFRGEFEGNDFDDVERVVWEGEYLTDSPTGVNPEGYRWVHRGTGTVAASYTSLSSSGSEDWKRKVTDINRESSFLPSGEYVLQVKSDADYPVDLGVRDFRIIKDEYIRYEDSKTYYPQLERGNNLVEIFTSNSNNLDYELKWDECSAGDIIQSRSPANNTFVSSLSPTISVTTGCWKMDEVSIKDARTDTVLASQENVDSGTKIQAETDLNLGESYSYYVRFCDQDVCYDSDVSSFTVGEKKSGSGSIGRKVLDTQGLPEVIRDEDYNSLGKNSPEGNALHDGYVNKLEEESDQLEPGMGTASFDMGSDSSGITVSRWSDSVGSEDRADQYAITGKRNWSISNRGTPYPPYGTYYRSVDDRDLSTTTSKTDKVFGNSISVIARQDIHNGGDLVATEGAGVWIDPDELDEWADSGGRYKFKFGDWYDVFRYRQQTGSGRALVGRNMDLTADDSGLGIDDGSSDGLTTALDHEKIRKGDIYFDGEDK